MVAAIDTMSRIIEAKDPYTADHQHRVSQLAITITKELNLSPDKIEGMMTPLDLLRLRQKAGSGYSLGAKFFSDFI